MKLPLAIAIFAVGALYVGCACLLSSMFMRSADHPSNLVHRPAFRMTSTVQTLAGVVGLACLIYWFVFYR